METVLIVSDIYIINESLNSFFSNDYKFKNIIIKDDLAKVEFEELKTIDLLIVNVKSKSYNELFRYIDYKSKFNLEVKIVALDLCGDYKFFLKIMNSNINGYLLDIDNKEELLYKIKKILKYGEYFDTDLLYSILEEKYMYNKRTFSEREKEILEIVNLGESNKSIATSLEISENTVKRHISNILDKLGLKNKKEVINYFNEV